MFEVKYLILASGVTLSKSFDSPYLARKFINKLKHSRVCRLVSYPIV